MSNEVHVVDQPQGFPLVSPNGTRYVLSVDNAGVLSTVAL